MNSARNLQDIPNGEQASLYVLELLPPAERRDFERKLAADPALRTLVRELQGNVDALVLAEPIPPAPVSVWGRIAAEVKVSEAPLLAFPEGVRAWGLRMLAAAACLALGALLHLWLAAATKPGPDAAVAQVPAPAAEAPVMFVTNHIVIQEVVPVPVSGEPANGPAPASGAAQAEVARLRQRVNMLASQVSALNQVLTQRLVLPNGVTRLHVFQLVGTNGLELPPPSLQSLPETLAQLATGQVPAPANIGVVPTETAVTNRLAAAHDPAVATTTPTATSTTGTTGTTPAATTAVPTSTGAFTNNFASVPTLLNNGQPLGFFNPDTGDGVAVVNSVTSLDNMKYVVWQLSTDSTGAASYHSVGTSVAGTGTTLIPFVASTNAPGSFSIWLQPIGTGDNLPFPTGQLVATPPGSGN